MSFIPTYSCFGCVEWAHNERTKAYIAWACRTGRLDAGCIPPTSWMCTCPNDTPEIAFDNPIDDEVCWYDPNVPESADFLGAVIRKETGIRDSTFTRELVDGLTGGSILQTPKVVGKQIVFEILLYATSEAGMNYGIEWMRRQFEENDNCPKDGGSCSSCQGQLLTVRVHCADPETTHDQGLHSFASAGTLDGLKLLDEFPMGRGCCNIVRAYTLTIATESHKSFSTEPVSSCTVTAADDAVFSALGICNQPLPDRPCCPFCDTGCDECTTDPGCDCFPPFVLTPETIGSIAPCFSDPVCRCIAAISVTNLPSGYESTFRLTLQAGFDASNPTFQKFGLRNPVIRIFENPQGLALPVDLETYQDLVSRMIPCAEIGVSWIPKGSELVIDGLSGRMWLKCNGRCVDHSSRVFTVTGDVFPLKARCADFIATVEWDCLNVQDDDSPGKTPSSFTLETFTGHVL